MRQVSQTHAGGSSRRRFGQSLGVAALTPSLLAPLLPATAGASTAGATFAGAVAGSQVTGSQAAGLGGVAHKIGVVVPTSRHLPQLGSDFVTGLRMALAGAATQALGPVALVLSEYDGARPAMGLQQIQTLAARDDLTMLTAFVEPDRAQGLQAVLAKHEMPLLVCEVGANVSRLGANGTASSVQTSFNSHVAVQSLGAWQSNHRAGAWAAKQLGKRGVQAMGWRESGYDLPYAFRHGFEGAGGEVLGQHVSFQATQSQPAKGQLTQAQAFAGLAGLVRSTRPDFVHALYSGSDATAFATFYHQAGLDLIAPLVGGGFLTDGSVANGSARVPLRGAEVGTRPVAMHGVWRKLPARRPSRVATCDVGLRGRASDFERPANQPRRRCGFGPNRERCGEFNPKRDLTPDSSPLAARRLERKPGGRFAPYRWRRHLWPTQLARSANGLDVRIFIGLEWVNIHLF
jgi:hypothetical protein